MRFFSERWGIKNKENRKGKKQAISVLIIDDDNDDTHLNLRKLLKDQRRINRNLLGPEKTILGLNNRNLVSWHH